MELKFVLESLLFHAQKPISPAELRDVLVTTADRTEAPEVKAMKKIKESDIVAALEVLAREHEDLARSYRLVCVAGNWQFVNQPEFGSWLRVMLGEKPRPPRLSQPGLETLAIIAYRQPLTRAEIEQIRGVSVDGVMQTLLERGLVEAVGRAEVIGRPMTYGTTAFFLEYFGLRNLEDLPAAEELRRIEIKKPETLMTVDAGLATVPGDSASTESSAAAAPELPLGCAAPAPCAPSTQEEPAPGTPEDSTPPAPPAQPQ